MSLQQTAQPRSSANGFGRRRTDRDSLFKTENTLQSGKMPGKSSTVGKEGVFGSPPRERLVYMTTCLIGHNVEVQVLDGSVYSGILHATNAEDFGVILKMARLIRGGSRGVKSNSDFINKPPSKILIIPSGELVQVIAKDVPITHDGLISELLAENKQELMTDSCISQSRHVEIERELGRWVPDDDLPECPELEHIFDGSWNRGWDQFEVNETLFGVKSTFNEELYTTRLEKGPQMRELENEALRIAREIEGEDTSDLHLAEERGIQLHENLEVDEETRFSSVVRKEDDSGYEDTEDTLLDYHNDETFGGVSSSTGPIIVSELSSAKTAHNAGSSPDALPKEEDSVKARLSADATSYGLSHVSLNSHDKGSFPSEQPKVEVYSKTQGTAHPSDSVAGHSSSASSNSKIGIAASTSSGPRISPSSSTNSLSSEKSNLNPYAKEFRLNPNAKSFAPSRSPMRPASPVPDGSFYYPANMATAPHMHGMAVGLGLGPPTYPAHQPVIFNQQVTGTQPYFPPSGPQMMFGHPRRLVYMPTYPPAEMQYKGREY